MTNRKKITNFDLLNYLKQEISSSTFQPVGNDLIRVNPCPICGHNDCCTVYNSTNSYTCFSHDGGGTIVDFLMEYETFSEAEALKKIDNLSGFKKKIKEKNTMSKKVDFSSIQTYYDKVSQTDYFEKRGISKTLIDKYRLGYDEKKYAVTLPCFDENGQAVFLTKRKINPRDENEKYYNACSTEIFNEKLLYQNEPLVTFITEGMFDALSIEETLGIPAVAINSCNNVDKLIKKIKDKDIAPNKHLVFIKDDDQAGRTAAGKLKEMNVSIYNLKKYHDTNEYLQHNDKAKLKLELQKIQDSFLHKDFNYGYINKFYKKLKQTKGSAIKTGYKNLDDVLNGGLYPGLYVIGAISSLGKSTYCLQLADQIAAQKNDVIFFALEQSRFELTSKSVVREIYKNNNAADQIITTTDFLNRRIKPDNEFLLQGLKDYQQNISKNISISEGIKSVKEIKTEAEKIIDLRQTKPVVIIDYLQIIKSDDNNMSQRQSVDYNLGQLKELSTKFEIPVIIISSLNRHNYSNLISFESFKESGTIEYSSDVVLGMQLAQMRDTKIINTKKIEDWKAENPRKIELIVLKQRNGQAYSKILYKYQTIFNQFTEIDII